MNRIRVISLCYKQQIKIISNLTLKQRYIHTAIEKCFKTKLASHAII